MDCLAANLLSASTSVIAKSRYYSLPEICHIPPSSASCFRCTSSSSTDLLCRDENLVTGTSTLRELCQGHVREHILQRVEDVGFVVPTDVQRQALPVLLSGRDCVLHAQTGSGKTLAYMLLIFALVDEKRSSVQALIVVPTRELGIQVTKVARTLVTTPLGSAKSCSIMSLLDGGLLKRQKGWIKIEPPTIVVATIDSLCRMVEKGIFKLEMIRVLVIDEVDFMFSSSKEASSLRKLLGSGLFRSDRQTVFASASIPQHRQFMRNCVQQKWTKRDVVHVHVNPVEPMPSRLHHRFLICDRESRLESLLSLLQSDQPESGIVFVNEKEEAGTTLVVDFLNASYRGGLTIHHLHDDMNFNRRATSLLEVRQGGGRLLVATDIAARGVDLPEVTHIYNLDVPRTAVEYLHRAGRTGRNPFSEDTCVVTTVLPEEQLFVLQRFQNELMFHSHQTFLSP